MDIELHEIKVTLSRDQKEEIFKRLYQERKNSILLK